MKFKFPKGRVCYIRYNDETAANNAFSYCQDVSLEDKNVKVAIVSDEMWQYETMVFCFTFLFFFLFFCWNCDFLVVSQCFLCEFYFFYKKKTKKNKISCINCHRQNLYQWMEMTNQNRMCTTLQHHNQQSLECLMHLALHQHHPSQMPNQLCKIFNFFFF